jgi:mannose-6-phosphate isomerase-like protein (cupin superfamily)
MNYKEKRPWGEFENLLDVDYCKVKKIIIQPGQAPSYQYHFKREEVWVVVKGEGKLILDDVESSVSLGSIVNVPIETKHRIRNTGDKNLIFIEVQLGEYLGDIVRLEDDYDR